MAEFRIKRVDIVKDTLVCKPALDLFDQVVVEQANGSPDLVFPDGWTELHSLMLYQSHPEYHLWLRRHKLIPNDKVHTRFPNPLFKSVFADYPKDGPQPPRGFLGT